MTDQPQQDTAPRPAAIVSRRQALRLSALAGGGIAAIATAGAVPALASTNPAAARWTGPILSAAGSVIFDDDFSGTLGAWTVVSGTAQIDNGALLLNRTIDGPTELHAGDPEWRDYTFEVDVDITDGGNYQAALLFRLKNATTCYNLAIRSASNPYDPNQLVLYRVLAGQYQELGRDNSVIINSDQSYHYKITVIGNQVQISFDNELSPRISVTDDGITYGAVGVNTYNTEARFDNVHVDVTATGQPITSMTPTLHYRPETGWLGDGHPLYRNGQWNMLFLEVPNEPNRNGLAGIHQSLAVSTDLVTWTSTPVSHTNPDLDWWAIANIEYNGKLYSLHNNVQTNDGYSLEVSDDGRNWTSAATAPVFAYSRLPGEARDPFIYQHPNGQFWLVMAIKRPNVPFEKSGAFYYSTSDDLLTWSVNHPGMPGDCVKRSARPVVGLQCERRTRPRARRVAGRRSTGRGGGG